MPSDLARIAFVARRFQDLQGLHLVVFGGTLVLSGAAWMLLGAGYRDLYTTVLVPAEMVAIAFVPRVARYYEQSFGRARESTTRGSFWRLQSSTWPLGGTTLAFVAGLMADGVKGFAYSGGVSLCAVALAGYSLRVLIRDWPNRAHYVIGLAVGVGSMLVTAALPMAWGTYFNMDPVVASQYVFAYALMGLGLVALGVLDHRLLACVMCRPAQCGAKPQAPDPSMVRMRLGFSGAFLAAMLCSIAFGGWPRNAFVVYMSMQLALMGSMMLVSVSEMIAGLSSLSVASAEWARRREAKLLAQIAAMKGGAPSADAAEEAQPVVAVPAPDLLGHVVLPFLMACGALIDVASRGTGAPSLLALALGASHLRIATRDWPSRGYYLLGAAAGTVSAVHYMFIEQHQALDWAVTFILLVSGAMLIEAVLDLHLTRRSTVQTEHHADAI